LRAIVRGERLLRLGEPLTEDQAKIVAMADCCRLTNIRDRVQRILDSFRATDSDPGSPS
jgi:hypothetical protein